MRPDEMYQRVLRELTDEFAKTLSVKIFTNPLSIKIFEKSWQSGKDLSDWKR